MKNKKPTRPRNNTPTKKQANQDKIKAEKQLIKAAEIFEDWKHTLLGTPTLASELPGKLNELGARIETAIDNPVLRLAILNLIELKIGDTVLAKNVSNYMLKIHAICPNILKVNNVEMICNWAGDALVNRVNWGKKQARFACPKCQGLIHQKSMKKVDLTLN